METEEFSSVFQALALGQRRYADGSETAKSARGRSRTGTAEAEGFSYQLQLSLLRQFLKAHLWSGLSLYRIAEQHYHVGEVGRSRQVSTLSSVTHLTDAVEKSTSMSPCSNLSEQEARQGLARDYHHHYVLRFPRI